ncbi:pilin [Facilibium subflavum]|uniref:pilin n=1 Tax=Facilibium subflavum TaxID=2219058 RepID=UPI0038B408F5
MYTNFVDHSKTAQTITALNDAQNKVTNEIINRGFKHAQVISGLSSYTTKVDNYGILVVHSSGAITFTANQVIDNMNGNTIVLTPSIKDMKVHWNCHPKHSYLAKKLCNA